MLPKTLKTAPRMTKFYHIFDDSNSSETLREISFMDILFDVLLMNLFFLNVFRKLEFN